MAETSKSRAKPISDVAHPGKSAPSDTSKAVIVNNRPILRDPMMAEESAPAVEHTKNIADLAKEALARRQSAPKLAPTSEPETESESESEPAPAKPKPEKPKAELKLEPTPPESEPKEPKKADDKPAKDSEDAQADEAAESETDPETETDSDSKPAPDPEGDAENIKREAALEELVDGKKYFLPINSVERRRSKRIVIGGVLLSLILIVAWVDIALDASLIQLGGLKSVTHFFST
jgi:hypothetical protein